MKKYPCFLIHWDEEMRGRELSCEEFLLCASLKEIRYDKLVSMDGKYKHIQKKNAWKCFHVLLLISFILIFKRRYSFSTNVQIHAKYKSVFIYRSSFHQTVYSFLSDN